MTDLKFLELVRASIAVKQVPKKNLARRCKISRAYFSLMLHGDKPMTAEVKNRLVEELGLEPYMEKLDAKQHFSSACS